ncbi:MAG: hypothetical protein WB997_01860, partial [Candidatus Acidiferrales bacterium]
PPRRTDGAGAISRVRVLASGAVLRCAVWCLPGAEGVPCAAREVARGAETSGAEMPVEPLEQADCGADGDAEGEGVQEELHVFLSL